MLFSLIFHLGCKELEPTGEKMNKLYATAGNFVVRFPPYIHFRLTTHFFTRHYHASSTFRQSRLLVKQNFDRDSSCYGQMKAHCFDLWLTSYAPKLVALSFHSNSFILQRKTPSIPWNTTPVQSVSPIATGTSFFTLFRVRLYDLLFACQKR